MKENPNLRFLNLLLLILPTLIYAFDNYDEFCIRVDDKILPGDELLEFDGYT